MVSTYGFARLFTDLPSGVALERIGETRVALGGTVLLDDRVLLGALSPTVEVILARVLSGLGSGLMTAGDPDGPVVDGGRAQSRLSDEPLPVANTGIAIYPLLGGAIGAILGWRLTFVVAGTGAIAAGALLIPLLRRIEAGRKREVVGPGGHP